MFHTRRGLTNLGLAFLLAGVGACEGPQQAKPIDIQSNGFPGIEDGQVALVSAVCSILNSGNMDFRIGVGETGYLYKRTSDGKIVSNGAKADGTECTIDATSLSGASGKKIIVTGTTGDEKLIVDFMNGVFAQAANASTLSGGTITNNAVIQVDMAAGTDTVKFRGTVNNDVATLGTTGAYSYLVFVGGSVATAPATLAAYTGTARTIHDVTMQNIENVVVSTGPGYDSISGLGIGGTVNGASNLNELAGNISMTLYGGSEADVITSGAASTGGAANSMYGNEDNDIFLQQVKKAKDVISGGAGTDSIDYSVRAAGVTVTLGGSPAVYATGSITAVAKASLVNNDRFVLNDGSAKTFAYKVAAYTAATGSLTIADVTALGDGSSPSTVTIGDGTKTVIFCLDTTTDASSTCATPDATHATVVIDNTSGQEAAAATAIDTALTGKGMTGISHSAATATVSWTKASVATTGLLPTATTTMSGSAGTIANTAGTGPTAAATVIDLTSANISVALEVADATAAVINAAGMAIQAFTDQASASSPIISLVATQTGTAANVTITATKSSGSFTLTGMAGGAAIGTTADDGESGEGDDIGADVEDVLGTAYADVIDCSAATGVGHKIIGLGGADLLIGSDGADTIYGGGGDDILKGGDGADTLYGGNGNNTLQGGHGNDTINGAGADCPASWTALAIAFASGACSATTTTGSNTIDFSDRLATEAVTCSLATTTNPLLCGDQSGTPEVETWSNIANIRGGAGADTLTGDGNPNSIWGGLGADTIKGGGGNDTLYGEGGDDNIDGEAGNDYLSGGAGFDTLQGGAGNDFVDADDGRKDTSVSCGTTMESDIGVTDARDPTKVNCQL